MKGKPYPCYKTAKVKPVIDRRVEQLMRDVTLLQRQVGDLLKTNPFDGIYNTERGAKLLDDVLQKSLPKFVKETKNGLLIHYAPLRYIFTHPIKWWRTLEIHNKKYWLYKTLRRKGYD